MSKRNSSSQNSDNKNGKRRKTAEEEFQECERRGEEEAKFSLENSSRNEKDNNPHGFGTSIMKPLSIPSTTNKTADDSDVTDSDEEPDSPAQSPSSTPNTSLDTTPNNNASETLVPKFRKAVRRIAKNIPSPNNTR